MPGMAEPRFVHSQDLGGTTVKRRALAELAAQIDLSARNPERKQ